MFPPTPVLVFALGCIGALAEELVKLYGLRMNPPKGVFSLWYCLASIPYAVLGGIVALILPATTAWGAFYAGITMPMLISTAAKHRKKPRTLSDKQSQNIVRAIDQTPDHNITKASRPQKTFFQTERTFSWWIELIRDHADGLFI